MLAKYNQMIASILLLVSRSLEENNSTSWEWQESSNNNDSSKEVYVVFPQSNNDFPKEGQKEADKQSRKDYVPLNSMTLSQMKGGGGVSIAPLYYSKSTLPGLDYNRTTSTTPWWVPSRRRTRPTPAGTWTSLSSGSSVTKPMNNFQSQTSTSTEKTTSYFHGQGMSSSIDPEFKMTEQDMDASHTESTGMLRLSVTRAYYISKKTQLMDESQSLKEDMTSATTIPPTTTSATRRPSTTSSSSPLPPSHQLALSWMQWLAQKNPIKGTTTLMVKPKPSSKNKESDKKPPIPPPESKIGSNGPVLDSEEDLKKPPALLSSQKTNVAEENSSDETVGSLLLSLPGPPIPGKSHAIPENELKNSADESMPKDGNKKTTSKDVQKTTLENVPNFPGPPIQIPPKSTLQDNNSGLDMVRPELVTTENISFSTWGWWMPGNEFTVLNTNSKQSEDDSNPTTASMDDTKQLNSDMGQNEASSLASRPSTVSPSSLTEDALETVEPNLAGGLNSIVQALTSGDISNGLKMTGNDLKMSTSSPNLDGSEGDDVFQDLFTTIVYDMGMEKNGTNGSADQSGTLSLESFYPQNAAWELTSTVAPPSSTLSSRRKTTTKKPQTRPYKQKKPSLTNNKLSMGKDELQKSLDLLLDHNERLLDQLQVSFRLQHSFLQKIFNLVYS